MQCPICKKEIDEPAVEDRPRYFPFCSERCKLIDLGRWLDGKYQIPVKPDDESHDGDVEEPSAPKAPTRHGRTRRWWPVTPGVVSSPPTPRRRTLPPLALAR